MPFNPDFSKQAQKVVFPRKAVKASYSVGFFNDVPVARCSTPWKFGYVLGWETKLWWSYNWKNCKNKAIGVIKKLQSALPHRAILTICKCFIRPNLENGDFIYIAN